MINGVYVERIYVVLTLVLREQKHIWIVHFLVIVHLHVSHPLFIGGYVLLILHIHIILLGILLC